MATKPKPNKPKRKGTSPDGPGNRVKKGESKKRTKFSEANVKIFLEAIANGSSHTEACEAVGISIWTPYDWEEKHPEFGVKWRLSEKVRCATKLRPEAQRRAVDGWEEPVFGAAGHDMGTIQVGTVRKYDSKLLIYLINHDDPAYRTNIKLEGELTVNIADRLRRAEERLKKNAS